MPGEHFTEVGHRYFRKYGKRCCVDFSAITNMSEVFCETKKTARTHFAPIMPLQTGVGPKLK